MDDFSKFNTSYGMFGQYRATPDTFFIDLTQKKLEDFKISHELERLKTKMIELEKTSLNDTISSYVITFNDKFDEKTLYGLLSFDDEVLANYMRDQIKKNIEKVKNSSEGNCEEKKCENCYYHRHFSTKYLLCVGCFNGKTEIKGKDEKCSHWRRDE